MSITAVPSAGHGPVSPRHGVEPLTPAQQETLSMWRAMALQRMPYFATILFEMRPLNAPGLGTFAVDRQWRVYIDFDQVEQNGDLWCAESLLHEVGHLWYEHARRAVDAGLAGPDGQMKSAWHGTLSNFAGDCAINDDLIEAGCSTLADGVLPDSFGLPRHETYEFYVAKLQSRFPQQPGGSNGDDEATAGSGCGSGAGNLPREQELAGHDSLGGAATPATQADKDRAVQASASAIVEADSKSRGTVPGDLVHTAKAVLAPPQVPWQKVLKPALRSASSPRPGDDEQTYRRRNRRKLNAPFGGGRIIYPGTFSPAPRVALVRDNSGSVNDREFDAFTNEIVGIARQVGLTGDDLVVFDVDAAVQAVTKFRNAADVQVRRGCGGTDMRVGVERALALRPRINAIVILTDGETPWPTVRPRGVAVIACIVSSRPRSRSTFGVPPWMRVVWIEPAR